MVIREGETDPKGTEQGRKGIPEWWLNGRNSDWLDLETVSGQKLNKLVFI